MDCTALERRLTDGDIGCVVATLGATGTGSVDSLPEILRLRERFGFRVHVDAAYGGYFTLADNLSPSASRATFDCASIRPIPSSSTRINTGFSPTAAAARCSATRRSGALYKHDSPYTYFSSKELAPGRDQPGMFAARRLGCGALGNPASVAARGLGGRIRGWATAARAAAMEMARRLLEGFPLGRALPCRNWISSCGAARGRWRARHPDCRSRFSIKPRRKDLHLALIQLPISYFSQAGYEKDQEHILCLRSVLMKTEHAQWIDEIMERLNVAAG